MKVSKIEQNFEQFCDEYNPDSKETLNIESNKYKTETRASIIIFNKNQEILNEEFFEEFNYIMMEKNNKEFKIIIDFLIDEEGEFRNPNNRILKGEIIKIKGIKIKGTNVIEALEIETSDKIIVNDDAYADFEEIYKENNYEIVEIKGEVKNRKIIIRDEGVLSYQQEKLFQEVKNFWIQQKNNFKISDEEKYEFTEEYSGLKMVVLVKKLSDEVYAFSLFNIENIHEAFKILNNYYYYIFGFQFLLILILVFIYSKWITNPLLKLIQSAKNISKLDFTKRTNINSKDELSILSNSLNDISDNLSKTIEDLKKSNNKLEIESIKKSKNEKRMRNLLNDLSHEFKTPLGIISGFLEIIRDEVYEKDPKYYIDVMEKEIEKLDELVIETIELSKIETANYKLKLSKFEIKYVFQYVIKKLEQEILEKQLVVINKIEKQEVIGDFKKIERVITNILSNAIRYSPEKQKIKITSQIKNEKVYISVRNYGVIIESDDLEKIWDRLWN